MITHRVARRLALYLIVALSIAPSVGASDEDLLNARTPTEGVLFGGQPSAEQLAALAEEGYRILDLRTAEEDRGYDEPAEAERLGIEYLNLPVNGEALGLDQTYEDFFEAFEGDRPVVVHCASGNRVGALYYAWLVARDGRSRAEARELAEENGLRSEQLATAIDRWLDRQPEP